MHAVGYNLSFPISSTDEYGANDPASSDLSSASFSDGNEATSFLSASEIPTSAECGGKMLAVGCRLRFPINSTDDSATKDPAFQDSISLDLGPTSSSFIDNSSFLFCTHLASSMPESGVIRRLCLTSSGDSNAGVRGAAGGRMRY